MDKPKNKQVNEFAKLSWGERIAYGAGDLAQNLIFGTIGSMLLFYLTTAFGISAAVGATIFLIVRWVNVFWDPWVGTVVDKSHFKHGGKYKPFLIYFGIPLTICCAMLFLPIPAVRGNVAYAFLMYLATALIYSFVNIPYGSLNASLTRDNDEISTLTTVRMTEANIGNLLVYTFLPLFVQMASPAKHLKDIGMFGIKLNLGNYASPHAAGAYFHVMSIYMLIGFILLLCTYFGVHERVLPTEEETASVKFSDLWNELRRNKPLRVLGCFPGWLYLHVLWQYGLAILCSVQHWSLRMDGFNQSDWFDSRDLLGFLMANYSAQDRQKGILPTVLGNVYRWDAASLGMVMATV